MGDRLDDVPAARIGRALRTRRVADQMSEAHAAAAVGISAQDLREIEAGVRSPATSTVTGLLGLYACPIDEIIPPRRPLNPEQLAGLTNRQVLVQYLALVRGWRGLTRRRDIRFRPDDIAVLVGLLGADADQIERQLIQYTGCSESAARRFRRLLMASLIAVPVVGGVGLAIPQMSGAGAAGRPAWDGGTIVVPPLIRGVASTTPIFAVGRAPKHLRPATSGAAATTAAPAAAAHPAQGEEVAPTGDEEATVSIPSLNIELPIIEGGQGVIDEGVVAHYVGAGWLAPIAAGGVGTYWLAAHHVTHGGPFDRLPDIQIGAEVWVTTPSQTFIYTITSMENVGILAGFTPVYGTDPSARTILLQTCLSSTGRLLVHGILTAVS